jgi:hypothetical protein
MCSTPTENIVTHMSHARQRLGKHVPEVRLSTREGHLKAGIVNSEWTSIVRQRFAIAWLPRNYTRFQHNAYMNESNGTLEGGDFHPVLPKL